MSDVMINTATGPITALEAIQFIKREPDKATVVLSFLRQLKERFCHWEVRFAAQYILANASRYADRVVRMAQEVVSGVPVGPQKCQFHGQVCAVVEYVPADSVLKLVFKPGCYESRLAISALIELSKAEQMLCLPEGHEALFAAILISGDWGMPENQVILVTTTKKFNHSAFARKMATVLKEIEVVSTPLPIPDRYALECQTLLERHSEMRFEPDLFNQVCDTENFSEQRRRLQYISRDPSLTEVLELFWSDVARLDFLRAYVNVFYAALDG